MCSLNGGRCLSLESGRNETTASVQKPHLKNISFYTTAMDKVATEITS